VDVAGGTSVTVSGTAVPANPRVLVGATGSAQVTGSSATAVTFTVPRQIAGVYDVTVFNAAGTQSSTLVGALTYVDPAAGTSPVVAPTNPGTPPVVSPLPGIPPVVTPVPANPPVVSPTPGTNPGGGSAGPVVKAGPGGERLVQTARFTAFRSALSLSCTSSCSGMSI
jgi:hypothetical protein